MKFDFTRKNAKRPAAFTLVELLAVIAIIGLLAGLIVMAAGRASRGRIVARAQGELAELQTAIDAYHDTLGFYPPDNTNDVATPPLYYELVGTRYNGTTSNSFTPLISSDEIKVGDIQNNFKMDGFANSNPETVKTFLQLKKVQYAELEPNVQVLVLKTDGPARPDGKKLNTWRYNRTRPVHNPKRYDVWAEVIIAGKTNIIGNWKD